MVAEVALGGPHTPTLAVEDANGSPVLSGVTGSMSVYGPASAATPVAGPTALVHFGGGDWGITVPGSAHAAAGQYRYTVPSLVSGAQTLVDQGGDYTVGVIPPEYRTYRGIVVAVCEGLDCGVRGQATSNGTTTTLIDARWLDAGYAANEFVDDEILILEPVVGDANPARVSAYAPGTGTLTLKPAISAGGTVAGTDYLLIRPGRRGLRYARIKEAIDAAIADMARRQAVTDEVTLETTSNNRRHTYPTNWLDVTRVQINRNVASTYEWWEELPPADYQLWRDRRILYLEHYFGGGYALRLEGRVGLPDRHALGSLVRVPWTAVRDMALAHLMMTPAQRAGVLYQQARAQASRLDTRG
jgi:hypothetical protein